MSRAALREVEAKSFKDPSSEVRVGDFRQQQSAAVSII